MPIDKLGRLYHMFGKSPSVFSKLSLTQNIEHTIIGPSSFMPVFVGGYLEATVPEKARERIMVVDDSADVRAILRDMILEPQGYTVLVAQDGQEGLKRVLQEQPDLVMLDVNMPRMNGLQVLEKLRQAQYDWPVILITAEKSTEIAVEAFRLGVRDYIAKPLKIEETLHIVERVLVESRLRREKQALTRRLEKLNLALRHRVSELSTMYALGRALTSVLDQEKLLNRVVEAAAYLGRSDESTLYMVDEETGDLYMTAAQGVGEKAARGLRLRVSDSLVGEVVRTGQPMLISSKTAGPDLKVKTGYLVRSLLNVPLRAKERIMGVLSVANRIRRADFTQDDVKRMTAVADYAAIAIENARLYEATRRIAASDMLKRTVVTIAHYINTPLMALNMNMDRLVRAVQGGKIEDPEEMVAEAARLSQIKTEEISAVISILQDMASPRFVTYVDDIEMLDIENKVRQRLQYIKKKHQG